MRAPKILLALAALASTLLWPASPARAGMVCTVSATDMAFGAYDPLAAVPLDSTSSIRVTCTRTPGPAGRYEIQLSTGQSGSYNPRAMTNGVSQLNYNLYRNRNRTRIWGDGSSGTSVVRRRFGSFPVGSTRSRNHTVRGRVFAGQNVSVGTYLDTITVTVIF